MSEKKIKDSDYLYLSAVIRAREPKLLSREKTERMLDSGSFEEAARVLSECGYSEIRERSAAAVDRVLCEKRDDTFRELERSAPKKALLDIFRLKYDYHNVKVMIKAQGANLDGGYLLSDCGRVKVSVLTDSFNDDDYRFVPKPMGEAIAEAKSAFARSRNPQSSDIILDKAYFAELLVLAETAGDRFLQDYVRLQIDSANLRTAVRVSRIGRDSAFLKNSMIPGGTVDTGRIISAFEAREGIAILFSSTPLAAAAVIGEERMSGGSLTEFERRCDNAVTEYLKSAKMVSFGAAPVAAYLAALESEIGTARMVLTGLLAGIAPDTIRERLRESYV